MIPQHGVDRFFRPRLLNSSIFISEEFQHNEQAFTPQGYMAGMAQLLEEKPTVLGTG